MRFRVDGRVPIPRGLRGGPADLDLSGQQHPYFYPAQVARPRDAYAGRVTATSSRLQNQLTGADYDGRGKQTAIGVYGFSYDGGNHMISSVLNQSTEAYGYVGKVLADVVLNGRFADNERMIAYVELQQVEGRLAPEH